MTGRPRLSFAAVAVVLTVAAACGSDGGDDSAATTISVDTMAIADRRCDEARQDIADASEAFAEAAAGAEPTASQFAGFYEAVYRTHEDLSIHLRALPDPPDAAGYQRLVTAIDTVTRQLREGGVEAFRSGEPFGNLDYATLGDIAEDLGLRACENFARD